MVGCRTFNPVIGAFTAAGRLEVRHGEASLIDAPVDDLARAWKREPAVQGRPS